MRLPGCSSLSFMTSLPRSRAQAAAKRAAPSWQRTDSPLGAAASPQSSRLSPPPPLPVPFCIGADCPARQRAEVRAVPSQGRLPQYNGTRRVFSVIYVATKKSYGSAQELTLFILRFLQMSANSAYE